MKQFNWQFPGLLQFMSERGGEVSSWRKKVCLGGGYSSYLYLHRERKVPRLLWIARLIFFMYNMYRVFRIYCPIPIFAKVSIVSVISNRVEIESKENVGVQECRSEGVLGVLGVQECRSVGRQDCWSVGVLECSMSTQQPTLVRLSLYQRIQDVH